MGMNYEQERARRRQLKRKLEMIGDDYDFRAKCERLERENAALREALKPFADAAALIPEECGDFYDTFEHGAVVPRDYRRARAALSVSGANP